MACGLPGGVFKPALCAVQNIVRLSVLQFKLSLPLGFEGGYSRFLIYVMDVMDGMVNKE
jgi:hypothetical protein